MEYRKIVKAAINPAHIVSDKKDVLILLWSDANYFREIDDGYRVYYLSSVLYKKKYGIVAYFRTKCGFDSHYARDVRKMGRCQYCGMECRRLTRDHIRPRSHGYRNGPDNTAMCCSSCNTRKGTQWLGEWLVNEYLLGLHGGCSGSSYIYPILKHNLLSLVDSSSLLDPEIRIELMNGIQTIDEMFVSGY
jgi:hypothetical protein